MAFKSSSLSNPEATALLRSSISFRASSCCFSGSSLSHIFQSPVRVSTTSLKDGPLSSGEPFIHCPSSLTASHSSKLVVSSFPMRPSSCPSPSTIDAATLQGVSHTSTGVSGGHKGVSVPDQDQAHVVAGVSHSSAVSISSTYYINIPHVIFV